MSWSEQTVKQTACLREKQKQQQQAKCSTTKVFFYFQGKLFKRNQYETLYRSGDNAKNYQKGHLLPFSIYSFDERYGKSTFDYSNAVPQRAEWNMGVWKSFEKAIKRYTQLTCGCRYRGEMYLLTGTSQFYKNPAIKQPVSYRFT